MQGGRRAGTTQRKPPEKRGRPRSGGQPGPSTRQAPGGRSWCAGSLDPEGERAMQWWTFARSKATLRANLSVNSPMECITRGYRWCEAGRSARHAQIPRAGLAGTRRPVSAGHRACLRGSRLLSPRTPRWHPAGGVPSAVSRLGLPSVKSHMSHRDKPVTIGPTSGLPARGCPTCSRWSSDSRQSIHFPVYSCGAAKVSLDFSDTAGSAGAQPRRPARTASQIRRPSSAPATMACEQWPSQRATPSGDPVPYAARAPR